jgi:hypothetical protein
MSWLRTGFVKYCAEGGVELLWEDIGFIEKSISRFDVLDQRAICKDYFDIWHEHISEHDHIAAQNEGRRMANNHILRIQDKGFFRRAATAIADKLKKDERNGRTARECAMSEIRASLGMPEIAKNGEIGDNDDAAKAVS